MSVRCGAIWHAKRFPFVKEENVSCYDKVGEADCEEAQFAG
jgi:hypothetical protein